MRWAAGAVLLVAAFQGVLTLRFFADAAQYVEAFSAALDPHGFVEGFVLGPQAHVLVCGDYSDAVDGIDVEGVQLVLIDIGNSVNDGFQTLSRLHNTAKFMHLPIVMCCSKGLLRKEYVLRAMQGGAKDFVAKPFERELLLSKIEKHALKLTS